MLEKRSLQFVLILLSQEEPNHVQLNLNNQNQNDLDYSAISCRKHSAILTDYGGVGDEKTSNTKAFNSAISNLSQYANDGGAQLIVAPGGEVESNKLISIEQVAEVICKTRFFKPKCTIAIINFLFRNGYSFYAICLVILSVSSTASTKVVATIT
ncbi:unnamed protein product [Vicia faba]|uniref:Uncharacterized protein n=1 Tax=Vicia faba TaxID=3906 RepID=A0AAV1AJ99_VICFA|nr:unnamed protein product [Vicia faba]